MTKFFGYDLATHRNDESQFNTHLQLPYLRELDLSHNEVTETEALHLKMGNITKLNLSHNKIKLLYG